MGEHTTTGTQHASHSGGFPPFDTKTFPGQFAWLAITFAFLFVVLWRLAGPRIGGVIAARKTRVADDFAQAEQHRKDAEEAQAAYAAALAQARKAAHAMAEDNRKRIAGEIDAVKAQAETEAQSVTTAAESRIAQTRTAALAQVAQTAQDAAIAIVAHLTGETVSADDARAALSPVH